MQIVTDRGMDLTAEQLAGLDIHYVPLTFTLDGKTYRSGEDVQPEEFYKLLNATPSFPTTSQPSAGDFANLYRQLAVQDPEILSIHISSGLSGTINAARAACELVPEAKITIVDTKTLSGAEGWQVEAAARASKAGWNLEQILQLMERVRAAVDTLYTLATMKYLVHGGRISHIQGLLAGILNIKPIIGVEHEKGMYTQRGQARTLEQAILKLADTVAQQYAPGTALRLQLLHGANLEGTLLLKKRLEQLFKCTWLPTGAIAPVLGAHTGPGLVGLVYGPQTVFADLPW
jgi:DegV family protein with EDD domain